jgi:sigma-B regulation protein RsbU (phosphoserine phosphatase)
MADTQDRQTAAQPPPRSRSSRVFLRPREFWKRLTAGLEAEALWRQFATEAREGYGLYSRDVDWESKQASHWHRGLFIARSFFWALVLKLSPPRRVLLLAAFGLMIFSAFSDKEHNLTGFAALIFFVLLALELADRVAMKRDLQIAREIQGWLVPAEPPVVPGIDLAFATRPANTVSGDYYDAFWRNARTVPFGTGQPLAQEVETSRQLLLVVADVVGKSVPAALLMATLQASLHALAQVPSSLQELVARLNAYSCAHSADGRRFTTAFLAEFNTETRELCYVNAGHNLPMLRRKSGVIERLDRGGVPLGVMAEARYDTGTAQLQAGDTLLVFTDGVVEALNEQGHDFTEPRLLEIVARIETGSAAEVRNVVMSAVADFVGDARQHDDITCLVMCVGPTPTA